MRKLRCPHCDSTCKVANDTQAKYGSCPKCGKRIRLSPRHEDLPEAPPIAKPARTEAANSVPDEQPFPTLQSTGVDRASQNSTRKPFVVGTLLVLLFMLPIAIGAYFIGRSNGELVSAGLKDEASTTNADAPHMTFRPTADAQPKAELPKEQTDEQLEPATASAALTPEELYESVAAAVVELEVRDRSGDLLCTGTGFFVDDSGTLVTNAHVVLADGAAFVVARLFDETQLYIDKVSAVDKENDLAIVDVAIDGNEFVRLAIEPPQVGARVFAVGNPIGLRRTLSEGLVSGVREIDDQRSLIQTSAPISSGSSGGPLLEEKGNVIGVTTLELVVGQNLNFAVPAAAIQELLALDNDPQEIAKLSSPSDGPSEPKAAIEDRTFDEVDSLRGIKHVYVMFNEKSAEAEAAGLFASALKTSAELRLRGLGIPVLSSSDQSPDNRIAILYFRVGTMLERTDNEFFVYTVDVELRQTVALPNDTRDSNIYGAAVTWSPPGRLGLSGRSFLSGKVKSIVIEMAEEFANDYLKANPK